MFLSKRFLISFLGLSSFMPFLKAPLTLKEKAGVEIELIWIQSLKEQALSYKKNGFTKKEKACYLELAKKHEALGVLFQNNRLLADAAKHYQNATDFFQLAGCTTQAKKMNKQALQCQKCVN